MRRSGPIAVVLAAALAAVVLSACQPLGSRGAAEKTARSYYDEVQAGDRRAVAALSAPELVEPFGWWSAVEALRGLMPKDKPTDIRLVSWRVTAGTRNRTTLVHIYQYPQGALRVTTVLTSTGREGYRVLGLHIQPAGRGGRSPYNPPVRGQKEI